MSLPPTNFVNAEHTTGALAPLGLGQHPPGAARAGDARGRRRRLHRAQGRAAARASSPTASASPTRTSSIPRAGGSTSTRPWRAGSAALPLKDDAASARARRWPSSATASFRTASSSTPRAASGSRAWSATGCCASRPTAARRVVLEDGDPEVVARVERKFAEHRLAPRRHRRRPRRRARQPRERRLRRARPQDGLSSARCSPSRIATFRSPIAGATPPHWHY